MDHSGVPVACNFDCGGGCSLLAYTSNGKITKLIDNPEAGKYHRACVRGLQQGRVQGARDRLTSPLIRTGSRGSGEFREASWAEALDMVADRLKAIKEEHGMESVIYLGGSGGPRGSLHNPKRLTMRFLGMYGGFVERMNSYSTAASSFATPFVLGSNQVGFDAGSLEDSELIILWGANIVDNRFGSELESRIREARTRGVRVVVIEPRKTRTVKTLGTDWLPVYPGTDSALMLAVLHVLITEELVDREYIEKYCYGFDELERHVLGLDDGFPKTPEWAEGVCGTPRDRITWLARLYGETHPTTMIPGLSIQRTMGGEEAYRLSITLQATTGNIGVPGGSSGGYMAVTLPGPRVGSIGIPDNPVDIKIPVYTWPDMVLGGKAGGYQSDIKAIINVGGNYLIQGSDIHKNIRAFQKAEFTLGIDRFLTDTARHCDAVLPSTTFLERNDIVAGGGNYVLYSNKVQAKPEGTRHDYDIFCDLAERLGFGERYSEGKSEEDWLREFIEGSDVPDFEEFTRKGIHWGAEQKRVAFSDFIKDPEVYPLNTPSGKIQISSEAYAVTGGKAIPTSKPFETNEMYPLRLITPKSRYHIHSQNYNIKWFNDRERDGLWINPGDASERGIEDGDRIKVFTPQGTMVTESYVTEDIIKGVVCLYEGAWLDMKGSIDHGGSVNILTSTEPTLPSRGSRTHTVLVQVEKA